MAEVQYNPANTDFAGQFFGAANGAQSIMQRAQRMRMDQENQAMARKQFDVLMPSLQAKSEADVANAKATIDSYGITQQLRKEWATKKPDVERRVIDAMKLPTYDEQSTALLNIQQETSAYSLLPEAAGIVDAIKNSTAKTHTDALAARKIKADREADIFGAASKIEQIKASGEEGRKTAVATRKGMIPAEKLEADYKEQVASGDKAGAAQTKAALDKLNGPSGRSRADQIEELETKAVEAEQKGNHRLASAYRDAQKFVQDNSFDPGKFITPKPGGGAPATPQSPSAAASSQPSSVKLPSGINY